MTDAEIRCEICFSTLAPGQCAEDTNGRRWDVCRGECARQAGITEADSGQTHQAAVDAALEWTQEQRAEAGLE